MHTHNVEVIRQKITTLENASTFACPYSEEGLFLHIISVSLSSTQSLLWISPQELQGRPVL